MTDGSTVDSNYYNDSSEKLLASTTFFVQTASDVYSKSKSATKATKDSKDDGGDIAFALVTGMFSGILGGYNTVH